MALAAESGFNLRYRPEGLASHPATPFPNGTGRMQIPDATCPALPCAIQHVAKEQTVALRQASLHLRTMIRMANWPPAPVPTMLLRPSAENVPVMPTSGALHDGILSERVSLQRLLHLSSPSKCLSRSSPCRP